MPGACAPGFTLTPALQAEGFIKLKGVLLRIRGCRPLYHWANFYAPPASTGNSSSYGRRFIEVLCFDQIVAAKLLVCFGERAVSNKLFFVTHAHTGGRTNRMKLSTGDVVATVLNGL